jgi:hypothetical protein
VTYPAGEPGRHAASATLGAARAKIGSPRPSGPRFPRQPRRLGAELRQQIADQFTEGAYCQLCGGIHAGLSMPACPRVASFELDADGQLKSAVFWPDGEYDASGTYAASDAEEAGEPS